MKEIVVVSLLTTALLSTVPFANAQQAKKVPRIGLLSPFSPSATALWHGAFRQGLREHGWVEGKNISIEYRYAEGKRDRLPELAGDLVRLKVDVIVAAVNTDALAAKKATRTIPIVVASAGDPVTLGLVESLARPGGNVTGLSQIAPELAGKRLELLKEIVPKLSRVAVLWNPQGTTSPLSWKEIQLPARELGVQLHSLEARSLKDFDKAFEEAARTPAGALAIMPDPLFAGNLKRIAELAAKSRLPSIFHLEEFVASGGLVAYGVDRPDQFRRAAVYVDKILKGAKPADLPVEQPTKFELVINLKTAKQIGLTIPPNVLARADKVIK
ncbi:MAG: ABC transporter substrate-binding protein [Deltaproteobacteria bacterium]|nr:ABC transporter substrate-binding protein [Deltaproteobacteria bacterium]MBI2991911.1 ABC transporter substrate-binding protein [Deltaproteobacteria bacterium]